MAKAAEHMQTGPCGSRRRAAGPVRFALRFSARKIPSLAAENQDDREAFEAGRRIAAGSRERAILEWKTRGRGRSWPAPNRDAEVADALDLAVSARTERAAIAVLTGLSGGEVPVASAVMTAIDPQRFTIRDFRALWSLRVERATYTVGFWPRVAGSPPTSPPICARSTRRSGSIPESSSLRACEKVPLRCLQEPRARVHTDLSVIGRNYFCGYKWIGPNYLETPRQVFKSGRCPETTLIYSRFVAHRQEMMPAGGG
jgi:hypothetical protein